MSGSEEARQLARILDVMPGGIVQVGPDGSILRANDQAARFLGMAWDELGKRFVIDFAGDTFNEDGSHCPVEDYPVSRCLASGEAQPRRTIGVRQPSGEIRWAIFTALPFASPDGAAPGAVVTFVDITERRRAELRSGAQSRIHDLARLVRAEGDTSMEVFDEPLADLVQLSESRFGFVASLDAKVPLEGPIRVHALLDLDGREREEAGEPPAGLDALSRAALLSGAPCARLEPGSLGGAFGGRAPRVAVVFPLFAGQIPIGLVGLADARPGYPEAILGELALLADGCADLLRGLRERGSRAALSAQLAQAERLASVGTLAAGMAHEVNNPLAYVLLNLEASQRDADRLSDVVERLRTTLRERLGEKETVRLLAELGPQRLQALREQTRNASQGAQRVRQIVCDLMTFSRVTERSEGPIDVNAAVLVALEMSNHEIRYRAGLVRELGELKPVMGHEGRLSQVFLNLLLNAARAIEEGRPDENEIRVRTWTDGSEVRVEIMDTGEGIDPTHLRHLFEPFFSARVTGTGAGLGLSVCQNLVSEHGGRIEVSSELGVGSRFLVILPASDEPLVETGAPPVPEPPPPAATRLRLLLVDDEPLVRRVLGQLLGRRYDVIQADGLASATRALEEGAPDLVLCDMMMLDGTGVDVHEWVAEHRAELASRMIFMTGGTFTPRARAFLAEQGAPCLLKPFTIAQLEATVQELLG